MDPEPSGAPATPAGPPGANPAAAGSKSPWRCVPTEQYIEDDVEYSMDYSELFPDETKPEGTLPDAAPADEMRAASPGFAEELEVYEPPSVNGEYLDEPGEERLEFTDLEVEDLDVCTDTDWESAMSNSVAGARSDDGRSDDGRSNASDASNSDAMDVDMDEEVEAERQQAIELTYKMSNKLDGMLGPDGERLKVAAKTRRNLKPPPRAVSEGSGKFKKAKKKKAVELQEDAYGQVWDLTTVEKPNEEWPAAPEFATMGTMDESANLARALANPIKPVSAFVSRQP